MIPRILVPIGARPPAAEDAASQRRRPTTMDERTLVPAMLPIVPLNGHSTIPANLPLESIAARVVVPRDLNREAYQVTEDSSKPLQPTDMDERITVPVGAAPPESIEPLLNVPTDLVEPDIFTTGEVHLAVPQKQEDKTKWQVITRVSSIVFHVIVLTFILLSPKLFPAREPTQAEMELAQRQMTVLLPPGALERLKPSTPSTRPVQPPQPTVKVDPRILRQIAPPSFEPRPEPGPPEPERVVKNLPNAPIPKPQSDEVVPQPSLPIPKVDGPKPVAKLESPDQPQPQRGLKLPNSSGHSIQDLARDAAKGGSPQVIGGGDLPMPSGGGGQGSASAGIEVLTPLEGVDFSNYFARMHRTVERNWLAVYPESALLGERGVVTLRFRVMRDGSVPQGEPTLVRSSGKEALDRAAISSIRSSNPFQSLPAAFSGPYIELLATYYYNVPYDPTR